MLFHISSLNKIFNDKSDLDESFICFFFSSSISLSRVSASAFAVVCTWKCIIVVRISQKYLHLTGGNISSNITEKSQKRMEKYRRSKREKEMFSRLYFGVKSSHGSVPLLAIIGNSISWCTWYFLDNETKFDYLSTATNFNSTSL